MVIYEICDFRWWRDGTPDDQEAGRKHEIIATVLSGAKIVESSQCEFTRNWLLSTIFIARERACGLTKSDREHRLKRTEEAVTSLLVTGCFLLFL